MLQRRLKGVEWRTVQLSVLWAFEAVAGSDGSIDPSEQKKLMRILVQAYRTPDPALREVLMSVEAEFAAVKAAYVRDERDIYAGLGDAAKLIDRLRSPDDAMAFKRGLVDFAMKIAEASGGFLGFGSKVSRKERTALEKIATALGDDV